MTCAVCGVVCYVFRYLSVRVATLRVQTLPWSLNVLILYDDSGTNDEVKRAYVYPTGMD